MKKTFHLRYWFPVILWMGFIFLMSGMNGTDSGELSGGIIQSIFLLLEKIFGFHSTAALLSVSEFLLRKAAHMTEYAVLFFLTQRAFRLNNYGHPVISALIFCILYAGTDEIHQSFIDGRGPSVYDVAIDGSGTILAAAFFRIFRRKKNAKS